VKHKLDGIGSKAATATMMLLASTPMAWLAVGAWGTATHYLLTKLFSWLAGNGLILANVGISNIEIALQKNEWEKIINEAWTIVDNKTKELSDDEKKRIDDRVRDAHRKFASFGVRERKDT